MSASYIHRDPLVVNTNSVPLNATLSVCLAYGELTTTSMSIDSMSSYRGGLRPSCERYESPLSMKPSPPYAPISQVPSIQSPKMSPDSTLAHIPPLPTTTTSIIHYSSTPFSPTSAPMLSQERYLHSATLLNNNVTDMPDSQHGLVGSSTNTEFQSMEQHRANNPFDAHPSTTMQRPRSMTFPVISRPAVSLNSNSHTPSSTTTPASNGKKSSRRNPWGSETYSDLITVAIHSYPDHQATLQQIYDFIVANYEYFRARSDSTSSSGWKNSIRHNLSLHDRFAKCPKSTDNTKSSYWRINPDVGTKPYVRRRACSLADHTTSGHLKRSSLKTGNSSRNRARQHANNKNPTATTSADTASSIKHSSPLSVYLSNISHSTEMQAPTLSSLCDLKSPASHYPFGSAPPDSTEFDQLLSPATTAANSHHHHRWLRKHASSPNRCPPPTTGLFPVMTPNHHNYASSSSYEDDSPLTRSHLSFDSPTEFHQPVIVSSGTAASSMDRMTTLKSNSLIEHLLRSDPTSSVDCDTTCLDMRTHNMSSNAAASYIPNAFSHHPSPSSLNSNNLPSTTTTNFQDSVNDIRSPSYLYHPQQRSTTVHHYQQNHPNWSPSESFNLGLYCQSSVNSFQFTMPNVLTPSSTVCPNPILDVSNPSVPALDDFPTATILPQSSFFPKSGIGVRVASASPSTINSTCSPSISPWISGALNVGATSDLINGATLPLQTQNSTTTSPNNGRMRSSSTDVPSPVRLTTLLDVMDNDRCGLDTPPYQNQFAIKSEHIEVDESCNDSHKKSSPASRLSPPLVGALSVPFNSMISTLCTQFSDDTTTQELELSLELADRIIGSAASVSVSTVPGSN